ncbi:MAG TPA: hypothetical protein PKC89_04965, partial [Pyrinomonadaceae bacterium]|nr:hypothetical protein [Pyrinomonadaceae bacterium]
LPAIAKGAGSSRAFDGVKRFVTGKPAVKSKAQTQRPTNNEQRTTNSSLFVSENLFVQNIILS